MNNLEPDTNTLRKELKDLALINGLELGPQTMRALHERILAVAFELQKSTGRSTYVSDRFSPISSTQKKHAS
jgi:hypothetical protein